MPNEMLQLLGEQSFYDRLMGTAESDLPRWPDEATQRGYVGTSGPGLIGMTRAFLDILARDGAFVPGWRGLDFGAGFGRIAAVALQYGDPEQLDLADAWMQAIQLLQKNGFANRIMKTSDFVQHGELHQSTYDVIYSFSIFTHLSEAPFWHNLKALYVATKPGGTIYFTVRHEDFLANHTLRADIQAALKQEMAGTGFGYAIAFPNTPMAETYGDCIVTRDYLQEGCEANFGGVRTLGKVPKTFQHVYAITRASAE